MDIYTKILITDLLIAFFSYAISDLFDSYRGREKTTALFAYIGVAATCVFPFALIAWIWSF